VYQKAYVEFFVSPDKLAALLATLDRHPSITYMAVNAEGDVRSNMKQDTVNAVTWGVFPGALWLAAGACVLAAGRGCGAGCLPAAAEPHTHLPPPRLLNTYKHFYTHTHTHTHTACATGREIEQPTVVDPVSFLVWKDEAFDLWTSEWGSLYEEGSASRRVLADIAAHWWLISVVDNDHVKGDLFAVFGL
jgi:hypothetical protein